MRRGGGPILVRGIKRGINLSENREYLVHTKALGTWPPSICGRASAGGQAHWSVWGRQPQLVACVADLEEVGR